MAHRCSRVPLYPQSLFTMSAAQAWPHDAACCCAEARRWRGAPPRAGACFSISPPPHPPTPPHPTRPHTHQQPRIQQQTQAAQSHSTRGSFNCAPALPTWPPGASPDAAPPAHAPAAAGRWWRCAGGWWPQHACAPTAVAAPPAHPPHAAHPPAAAGWGGEQGHGLHCRDACVCQIASSCAQRQAPKTSMREASVQR